MERARCGVMREAAGRARAGSKVITSPSLRELEAGIVLWRRPAAMNDDQQPIGHSDTRPLLIVNPLEDSAFTAAADAQLDGCDDPLELEERLRPGYPRATVHARELAGESKRVWYVYRDGHWIPSRERR